MPNSSLRYLLDKVLYFGLVIPCYVESVTQRINKIKFECLDCLYLLKSRACIREPMYHKQPKAARHPAIWIATKCFHFWTIDTFIPRRSFEPTVAESRLLWSERSTTKPPRLGALEQSWKWSYPVLFLLFFSSRNNE